jgi:HK97 family phage major capsid protein
MHSGRRDIVSEKAGSGYGGTGGQIIETHFQSGSFLDLLRNNCVIVRNCTQLGGLQGRLTFPKALTGTSAGWIGEDDDAPDTGVTFGQDALEHKTVAAYTQITREMLHQPSYDVDAYVRRDLAIAVAQAIDKAGFYGSGAGNEPKGLKNYNGVAAVQFTGGLPDYDNIVAMETGISASAAPEPLLTSPCPPPPR